MKYAYKTPEIKVKVDDFCVPGKTEKMNIDITLGQGELEVEGSAVELCQFLTTGLSEVKSFAEWAIKLIEDTSARQQAHYAQYESDLREAERTCGRYDKKSAEETAAGVTE